MNKNRKLHYSLGIRYVNEKTQEDLEESNNCTMEYIQKYFKDTEAKIEYFSGAMKNETDEFFKIILKRQMKEFRREIEKNMHYLNRIHISDIMAFPNIGKLANLISEESLADGYLSKDVIDTKVSLLKQISYNELNLKNNDLRHAAMLISEGYMTAEDVGQYGHILLSSSGKSPEYWGDYMGLYKIAGVYNNVPYYVQLNITSDDKRYMYLSNKHGWRASGKLGGDGEGLSNTNTDCAEFCK